MTVMAETDRLRLRLLGDGDEGFLVQLLNEPGFLQNIGDRNVRNADDARVYVKNGPAAMFEAYRVGLWMVEDRLSGEPLGMCGLLKRPNIDDFDIGYAFLEKHWGRGYAVEAGRACMEYAQRELALDRLVAYTALHNAASDRVLQKLGFVYDKVINFPTPENQSKLWVWEKGNGAPPARRHAG